MCSHQTPFQYTYSFETRSTLLGRHFVRECGHLMLISNSIRAYEINQWCYADVVVTEQGQQFMTDMIKYTRRT